MPKPLEIPVKKYIKKLEMESLEPFPQTVISYLIQCLLAEIHPNLAILEKELKEWTEDNIARLGLIRAHTVIKGFYGSKLANRLIHIPNPHQLWWEVLRVRPDAKADEVKKAYKNMSHQWHPDVNREPEADEVMKWVNKAWNDFRMIHS